MNHWDAAAAVLMKTRWESARERAQEPRPHTSYQSHQTILTHFYISVQIDEMKNLAWLVQPNCCLTEALTQRLEKSRRNVKLRLTAVSSSSFCLTLGGVSSGNTLYSLSLPPPSSCFKAAFARSSHRCWIRRSKPWFDADKSVLYLLTAVCCEYVQPYCKQQMPLWGDRSTGEMMMPCWGNPSQLMKRNVFDSLMNDSSDQERATPLEYVMMMP